MNSGNSYALILGASAGFGKATAIELAKNGFNIYGVHLDLGEARKNAELFAEEIRTYGVKANFFNLNAADEENRKQIVAKIKEDFSANENASIRVFLHSLAFGAIGSFFNNEPEEQVGRKKMEMTMNVMANSLMYWTQDLFNNGLLKANSRIFAMTSIGSERAMKGYGPVSIAKCALEAYIRQIAVELAPYKITANSIMAGITDTAAARKIPNFEKMLDFAQKFNPHHRNTIPEDVARTISLMVNEKSHWITGQILRVDGGESIMNTFE